MKILVTDSTELNFEVPEGVIVVPFDEELPIPAEHMDAEVVICWGAYPSLVCLRDMPNLGWVQSLSAGTDAFSRAGLPEGTILTSGRGLHDLTVTEHAVALLLALVRQIPDLVHAQDEHRWAQEKRGPKPVFDPERLTTLIGARVLIWGFGSIGQAMAPVLEALGCQVRGVAHESGERAGYQVLAVRDIHQALPETDALVMVLPSQPDTDGALSAEVLDLLPDRSVVCNVGRGSTIDEDALIRALKERRIAGAALDVMPVEPLPADSPLWDAPNCLLSPHIAGWRAYRAGELINYNFRAYIAGTPLKNEVKHLC
ncbi:NAD(P)-dependent oxidoreductase [Actinomycetaceae bacterium MB13-C1-2]|nr:NAD(P)-dependent oxidoreductase [Actinomycetaceae bacterium MB13-C1-2]